MENNISSIEWFNISPISFIKKIIKDYPNDCKVLDEILSDKIFLNNFLASKDFEDKELKKNYRSVLIQDLLRREDYKRIVKLCSTGNKKLVKDNLSRQGFYVLQSNVKIINFIIGNGYINTKSKTYSNFQYAYIHTPIKIASQFAVPGLSKFKKHCDNYLFNSSLDKDKISFLLNCKDINNNYILKDFLVSQDYYNHNMTNFRDEVSALLISEIYKEKKQNECLSLSDDNLYKLYSYISNKNVYTFAELSKNNFPLNKNISCNKIFSIVVKVPYNSNENINIVPAGVLLKDKEINLLTLMFLNQDGAGIDLYKSKFGIKESDLDKAELFLMHVYKLKNSDYIYKSIKNIQKYRSNMRAELVVDEKIVDSKPDLSKAWGL